ncbi:MAG: acyl carrier protein [Prevotellaceae bacterium]|jgi:acyl carrier protein|nr:acyl carrier protein [Prevotellaceae bacterium]
MNLDVFIKQIIEQFDNEDLHLVADSNFKEIAEYSSLVALSIIGVIDEEYNIIVSGDDMRQVSTIGELFELVKSKK